jgi:hypothetical protein
MPNTIDRLRLIVDHGWTTPLSLALVLGCEAAEITAILDGHAQPINALDDAISVLVAHYQAHIKAANAAFLRERLTRR